MAKTLRDDAVVVAVDQGTSSSKSVAVDHTGSVIGSALVNLRQRHPVAGWVEQDADEILYSVTHTLESLTETLGDRIVSIGLANQRESAVVWDRESGQALTPVIGWQDRRTAHRAEELLAAGHGDWVRRTSGLPLDPMFSALKFEWLLDEIDPDRTRSAAGELAIGTVDSWLVARLTGEHRIEAGNASRTQLLNVATVDWDDELLGLFRVPRAALPRIAASDEATAPLTSVKGLAADVSFDAVLGDSHAALYAHGIRQPGAVKVTYGTGSSIMGITSAQDASQRSGALVRTIAWSIADPAAGAVTAFEGNVLSTGATILWLSRVLDCDPNELDRLARTVEDSNGINLVPAFAGLGAPWWDSSAKAILSGFDLGTTSAHLARAAFDSITLQIEDVVRAAEQQTGNRIDVLLADGGPSRNDWLMQQQADLSGRSVARSTVAELSAVGVAHLAGITVGLWTQESLEKARAARFAFEPALVPEIAQTRHESWLDAVARARMDPRTPREPNPAPGSEREPSMI
jgi:glycerol kinase